MMREMSTGMKRDKTWRAGSGLSKFTALCHQTAGRRLRQNRLGDKWLTGQFAVEGPVLGVLQVERLGEIARVISQRAWDVVFIRSGQQDGDEPLVALFVVEVAVDDPALPEDTAAFVRRHLILDPLPVDSGANHQDEIGILGAESLLTPTRPAERRADAVLVQFHVHALGTEGVSQLEHRLCVLR